MFVNPEVDPGSLPTVERLEWQPLHPKFVLRLRIGALVFAGPLFLAASALTATTVMGASHPSVLELVVLWTMAAFFVARALFWPIVSVPRQGYALREEDIVYRKGVFWRSVIVVPFNRVQHTMTASGPLDRRFGLATLSVYPAGAGGQSIRGLGSQKAEELRAFISSRIETLAEPDAAVRPSEGLAADARNGSLKEGADGDERQP